MGARPKGERLRSTPPQAVISFDGVAQVLKQVLQGRADDVATQANSLESYAKLVEHQNALIAQLTTKNVELAEKLAAETQKSLDRDSMMVALELERQKQNAGAENEKRKWATIAQIGRGLLQASGVQALPGPPQAMPGYADQDEAKRPLASRLADAIELCLQNLKPETQEAIVNELTAEQFQRLNALLQETRASETNGPNDVS